MYQIVLFTKSYTSGLFSLSTSRRRVPRPCLHSSRYEGVIVWLENSRTLKHSQSWNQWWVFTEEACRSTTPSHSSKRYRFSFAVYFPETPYWDSTPRTPADAGLTAALGAPMLLRSKYRGSTFHLLLTYLGISVEVLLRRGGKQGPCDSQTDRDASSSLSVAQ